LFGTFKGISLESLGGAIDFLAENLRLSHVLNTFAGNLSGCQKQKFCTAIACLGNRLIVLMDDRTAVADVHARQLTWKTIASLMNTTSVIILHTGGSRNCFLRALRGRRSPDSFCRKSNELRDQLHCGYLLRVDRDEKVVGSVLDLVQSFIPGSRISEEHCDTIEVGIDPAVSCFIRAMMIRKDQLRVNSFSFGIEQLEDLLLEMIENG
jgi:hypothetical protein